MKKLISTIMYSNKVAKINEYEKFVKMDQNKEYDGKCGIGKSERNKSAGF